MNEQEKSEYELPEIEIVIFDESDVIRTSGWGEIEPFDNMNGFAIPNEEE